MDVYTVCYESLKMKKGEAMLDAETKRSIDTARDTLVGKVPDSKSQVEQMTIFFIIFEKE